MKSRKDDFRVLKSQENLAEIPENKKQCCHIAKIIVLDNKIDRLVKYNRNFFSVVSRCKPVIIKGIKIKTSSQVFISN